MKARIFLCLLLVVAMFAFVGCGGDDTDTSGALERDARNMVDDVERGIDDMTDGMMGNNANHTTDPAVSNHY